MQITVTNGDGAVYALDVSEDLQIMDLKALLEMETGIVTNQMILIFNMAPLTSDIATLKDCNIQEGDVLVVTKIDGNETPRQPSHQPAAAGVLPNIDWGAVRIPSMSGTQPRKIILSVHSQL